MNNHQVFSYPSALKFVDPEDYATVAVRAAIVLAVAYRAHSHKSLTPSGIAAAILTGIIHSLPPTNVYLILLITFFITSSQATKYKQEIKDKKVKVPVGKTPTEAPAESSTQRTWVQVLCNSGMASLLILASLFTVDYELTTMARAGVVAQYCGVIADTWSSEFGILSEESPFLLTSWPFKKVPPGTNGGVTKFGLLMGAAGSALLAMISSLFVDNNKIGHFVFFTVMGFIGTISDSLLGSFMQCTFLDTRDGKVLEPLGGQLVDQGILWEIKDNLKVVTGENVLSNNEVNILMSLQVTLLSMGLYIYIFG